MSSPSLESSLPQSVMRKLHSVRRHKMHVQIACALLAALAVLLAAMCLAMLIDWLATLYDSRWRVVLTFAALMAAALTTIGWIVFAWRRSLGIELIAGDVDRELPQLEERWTTITRLGADASKSNVVHPAMLRRVAKEAAGWEPHVEPAKVVSLSPLIRTLLCLTSVTAVLAISALIDARQTLVLVRRFWAPASSISATQLVDASGDIVVGRGEPVELGTKVDGIPVEQATLLLESADDPERAVNLVAHGSEQVKFSHRLRAVEAPFKYRFRAGDGQTEWFSVDVADRPEIETLQVVVTPPAYTRRPAESFEHLPRRISAMHKSKLELALRATMPVDRAILSLGGGKQVALDADAKGWFRWSTTLEQAFTLTPTVIESHGLTNLRAPTCDVVVYRDSPPAVKVLAPDDEMAVRPDDTIQITFAATDDVGILDAELVVYETPPGSEAVRVATIPIPLDEAAGATAIHESVDLDLSQFAAQDGTELSYEIRVQEDRGQSAEQASGPPTKMAANAKSPKRSASKDAAAALSAQKESSSKPQAVQSSAKLAQSDAQAPAAKQAKSNSPIGRQDSATTLSRSPRNAAAPPNNAIAAKPSSAPPFSRTAAPSTPSRPANAIERSAQSGQKPDAAVAKEQRVGEGVTQARDQQMAASANEKNDQQTRTNEIAKTKSVPEKAKSQGNVDSQTNSAPRTATSGRKGINAGGQSEATQKAMETSAEDAKTASSASSNGDPSQPGGQQRNSTANQTAAGDQKPTSPSDQPPGDSMPRRTLDVVPQSSTSQRMRLKVDQWAGSFSGQQRAKLELAIAPELEALDQVLAKAQSTASGVLNQLAANARWRASHDREVGTAETHVVECQRIIDRLEQRTKGTPYAFVGLQVVEIGLAHVEPAQNDFWKAIEANDGDRAASVRDAVQHITRARELLNDLRGRFERTRREVQLAESVEKVKKMYQVFIENSLALLQTQDSDPDRYNRKIAQFDVDDDYLRRLKEVLEMRAKLQAELARILADDPRLLRRFMDSLRNRSNNLREELAGLIERQTELNREVRAWAMVDEAARMQMARTLMLRHALRAGRLATEAGKLQDRYATWLPLNREAQDADLSATTQLVQDTATAATDLSTAAQSFIAAAQKSAAAKAAAEDAAPAAEASDSATEKDASAASGQTDLLAGAEHVYVQLGQLDVALRQIAAREDDPESASFAANRLVDVRRLIADSSAWLRQMKAHESGKYLAAAEVEQYRLAMKTDELASKLGSIEQLLSGMLQRTDGSLPEPIANKAREFLATLDREASPSQLAAVYALHNNQLPRARERQQAAGAALEKAKQQYDELMKLAIEELDKLPVQDPIADLLDDPTLDELLAQLEQELPLAELLGIPPRPSNLQIIYDWMRPGSGGGGSGMGAGQNMAANQVRQDEQRARNRLDQAYRRAIARALKETLELPKVEAPKSAKLSDWNRLVSKLGDDLRQGRDKAPPEQYRRAIEQYFSQISREVAESEAQRP